MQIPFTHANPSVSGQSHVEMNGSSHPSSLAFSTSASNSVRSASRRDTQLRVQPQLVPFISTPHSSSVVHPRISSTSAMNAFDHASQSSIAPPVDSPPPLDDSPGGSPVDDPPPVELPPVVPSPVVSTGAVVDESTVEALDVDGSADDELVPEFESDPPVVGLPVDGSPPPELDSPPPPVDDADPPSVIVAPPEPPHARVIRKDTGSKAIIKRMMAAP